MADISKEAVLAFGGKIEQAIGVFAENLINYVLNNCNLLQRDIANSFEELGESYGRDDQYELRTKPFILKCGFERTLESKQLITTTLDNLITKSNAEDFNSKQKEIEELMRKKVLELANVRERDDGRFEWRKMIAGVVHQIIERDPKKFYKEHSKYQKQLKQNTNGDKIVRASAPKQSRRVIDLAWTWFNLNKKGKIESGSEKQYTSRLKNNISALTKNIGEYTKSEILAFLNNVDGHRTRSYCHIILKNVFAEAAEEGITKRNVIATLKNDKGKTEKGLWFNVSEQRLIYESRHKSEMGNEIEFIILVGCRIGEAFNCRLELDRLRIWVERAKRDGSSGYVTISPKYAEHLKEHWSKMFKQAYHFYAREFGALLNLLEIMRQVNEKPLHRLRHTFGTNVYFLGADDKRRSHLMGHKKTSITNDVYTDFELDVTKQDILDIYGDLYPEF